MTIENMECRCGKESYYVINFYPVDCPNCHESSDVETGYYCNLDCDSLYAVLYDWIFTDRSFEAVYASNEYCKNCSTYFFGELIASGEQIRPKPRLTLETIPDFIAYSLVKSRGSYVLQTDVVELCYRDYLVFAEPKDVLDELRRYIRRYGKYFVGYAFPKRLYL